MVFSFGLRAKSDPFFWVKLNFGPQIWVELDQVAPQGPKTGPIGSGWPQIGFKFRFNPINLGPNPTQLNPNLDPILDQVGPRESKFGLSWVGLGPQGPNSG